MILDWNDLGSFLAFARPGSLSAALARHRSLSAAAKDLLVAQSTMGPRLTSLEAGLTGIGGPDGCRRTALAKLLPHSDR